MAQAVAALILLLAATAWPSYAAAPAAPKPAQLAWSELTAQQRQILAPLAQHWDSLDTTRRKKWVAIAGRYPKMKPEEQQRLQTRMKDWATLTIAERRVAREKFKALSKLPPQEREQVKAKWEEYQRWLAAQSAEKSGEEAQAPASQ